MLALDYSIDMTSKMNARVASAKKWADIKLLYEVLRPKIGHQKACQKVVKAMGLGSQGKGKQSLVSFGMASLIEYDYDRAIRTGRESKDVIKEILENDNNKKIYGKWLSPRNVAEMLRKTGHEKVWDDSYISSKVDS